ncbi:MAG: hypothetical protein IT453_02895 [Planctomycetes bacterium]|nr:hypothetical protein [Planctomycetota bacterium]
MLRGPRIGLLVVAALAATAAWWVLARESGRAVATFEPSADDAVAPSEPALDAPELALPAENFAPARADVAVAKVDVVRAPTSAPATGSLVGLVLLDESLASVTCSFALHLRPSGKVCGKFESQGEARVELRFDELLEGVYSLYVGALDTRELRVVHDLRVVAGEATRDAALAPLDLRDVCRVARYTLVDELGAPHRMQAVTATATVASSGSTTTDLRGDVDFLVSTTAERIDLAIEGTGHCVVSAPPTWQRSVVVVPHRPRYTLHVDERDWAAGIELGVLVRDAAPTSGTAPGRRDAVFARFDAASGDASLAPRRIGLHELEWRVKRADAEPVTVLDREQSFVVVEGAGMHYVDLTLPAAVRAALR